MPQHICGGQWTTCMSPFSPSIILVPRFGSKCYYLLRHLAAPIIGLISGLLPITFFMVFMSLPVRFSFVLT